MPSRWSSPGASAAAALLLAAALGAAAPVPAAAATVVERRLDVEVRGDGSLDERTHLEVRLAGGGDEREWSPFPVYLDENRTLAALSAWVESPGGARRELGHKDFDDADLDVYSTLHGSAKARLVRFPEAGPGAVLGLEYEVIERPYFTGGRLRLTGEEAIEHLSVRVHAAPATPGWRWRIEGPAAGLAAAGGPGEVTVTARGLPRPPPVDGAPDSAREATLAFAWGEAASWEAVGRWFDALARPVARGDAAVRRAARERLARLPPGAGARERLDVLLSFLQREVRYVAVEVGIGGYRPSPPKETLERRWGDCKAKAFLLLDLLAEARIDAYPALVYSGADRPVDPAFPSPFGFNHLIVALDAAGLAPAAADPVAGGYLFVDPTQEAGGSRFLAPSTQDQPALVVRGGAGALVTTPLLPGTEVRRLAVQLAAQPDGGGAGGVRVELRGSAAEREVSRLAERPAGEAEGEVRTLLGAAFPAASLAGARWDRGPGEVPELALSAGLYEPRLVATGVDGERSLAFRGLTATPDPAAIEGRTLPFTLRPETVESTLQVTLPEGWCRRERDEVAVDNAVGSFRQTAGCDGQLLTVSRRTVIARRLVPAELLPRLAELAAAEHRASARRIRLGRAAPAP